MRIKIDENVPARVAPLLRDMGHKVDTVPDEGLTGADDKTLWAATRDSGRLLITQDLDFSDVRSVEAGASYGVLLLRLRCPGRNAIAQRVRSLFQTEDVDAWTGCVVVASDHKVRVRRP